MGNLYLGQWATQVKNRVKITFLSEDTKIIDALEEFIKGAELHGKGILESDPDMANRGIRQVMDASKIIKKLDPSFSNLKPLLKHHNVSVRMAAAARLLATDKELALPVLGEIDKQRGFLGFTAHMIIQQWEKGELHLD